MVLYIDIENKQLVKSATSNRIAPAPVFIQGDKEPIYIHLLKSGSVNVYDEIELTNNDTLRIALARFEDAPNVLTHTETFSVEESGVRTSLPLNTVEINNVLVNKPYVNVYLEVEYTDSSDNIQTVLQIQVMLKGDLIENNPPIELIPSYDSYKTACEAAQTASETAANNAEQSAGLASDFSQAAQAAADAASVSEFNAQTAKTAAETAATNAANSAGAAAVYSEDCGAMLNTATNAANLAQEVSRIAIVPITATSQTIQPNKCYTLLTNDVDAYTLTPEMPSGNPEYLLQAVVQLKTGSAAPVINWGGNPSFFNGKIPTINANSSYDVIFEFDNLTLSWTVGVMKK